MNIDVYNSKSSFFVVYCNKLMHTFSYNCLLNYISAQYNLSVYTTVYYSTFIKLTLKF